MFEMHLRQPGFTYSTHGPFTKTNKEYKNLQKLEIHDIFIETNQMKLAFNESAKSRALRVYVLACSRAQRACVLACLTYSRA